MGISEWTQPNYCNFNQVISQHYTQVLVPPFQRRFSWGLHQAKDLLADLSKVVGSDSDRTQDFCFLGTIMFQKVGNTTG